MFTKDAKFVHKIYDFSKVFVFLPWFPADWEAHRPLLDLLRRRIFPLDRLRPWYYALHINDF